MVSITVGTEVTAYRVTTTVLPPVRMTAGKQGQLVALGGVADSCQASGWSQKQLPNLPAQAFLQHPSAPINPADCCRS